MRYPAKQVGTKTVTFVYDVFVCAGMKWTVKPERNGYLLVEKINRASRPQKWKQPEHVEQTMFPDFKPGMTTAQYVAHFDNMNNLKHTHEPVEWDRPAPMLDPALPEVWEDIE